MISHFENKHALYDEESYCNTFANFGNSSFWILNFLGVLPTM
jgi:hypothetical protein